MQHRVYFDYASTTNIHPEVLKSYIHILESNYANSESLYDEGTEVHRMMERARNAAAGLLGINKDEIIFTSGSSEANSMAIKGVAFAVPDKKHIVVSQIEHSSIINACRQLEKVFGYEITYLPVGIEGVVSVEDVKNAVKEDTVLVSVMMMNNETGAINPIAEIAEYVKKNTHAYMHVDMTQSIGKIACSLENIDLASISAHKIEGLKGSGILIKKIHVPIEPIISGGEQEYGLRGGTSNAPANIVFAKTLRLALENQKKSHEQICKLKAVLLGQLIQIPGIEINSPSNGAECIINFSYEKIPSEVMQNALNRAGFMVSARSTCESNSNNPSYVLKAMGFSDRRASSCIRISLSYHNTEDEVLSFVEVLKEVINKYG